VIGIIPCAGTATRMGGLAKFLLPIPGGSLINVLIERMKLATTGIVIATSDANRDLLIHLDYTRDRPRPGWVNVSNVFTTATMNETLIHAQLNVRPDDNILFGMPDTFFDDTDAFHKLASALDNGADVAVGVFRARDGQRNGGMVRVDGAQVVEVIDKPESGDYDYIWGVLAWRPVFWGMLRADEPHVGYGLPRAVEAGLDVRAVVMNGGFWDCGSVDGYFSLINHLTEKVSA
jgi:molybdopterin-guanine dinucleotide biosynthesis protein A